MRMAERLPFPNNPPCQTGRAAFQLHLVPIRSLACRKLAPLIVGIPEALYLQQLLESAILPHLAEEVEGLHLHGETDSIPRGMIMPPETPLTEEIETGTMKSLPTWVNSRHDGQSHPSDDRRGHHGHPDQGRVSEDTIMKDLTTTVFGTKKGYVSDVTTK